MHLSPEFGLTYKQIEADGFSINKKVEMLLSSDTSVGISKSIGLGVIGFSDAINELNPDLVLVLGDRFEILAACIAAMIARIPIAHCHGGEATAGLIDEPIRHSITKMSHLHFVSTLEYKKRVIQLGEDPKRVFLTGALGIENINRLELLSKKEFENSIGFKLKKKNFLITFHPVTLEKSTAKTQFTELIAAIEKLDETGFIFTKPNADTDGRVIIQLIDEYVASNSDKAIAFISLGQLRYLSALKYVDGVIGNSSSGLIEAPSFKIGTINIGDRQQGRVKGDTIIDCLPERRSIARSIARLYSNEFKKQLFNSVNPYGTKNASDLIVKQLDTFPLEGILKKNFYNV